MKYIVQRLPNVGKVQVYRVKEETVDGTEFTRVDVYNVTGKERGVCTACVSERGALTLHKSRSCKHVQAVKRFVLKEKRKAETANTLKSALNTIMNLE